MYENDPAYAANRLNGTIVRLNDGTPITIMQVERLRKGPPRVVYTDLGGDGTNKAARYNEIDVTPVPLGWASMPQGAIYLQREPKRNDWRQGLRRANYLAVAGGIDKRRLSDISLKDCILGKYLAYELAVDEAYNHGVTVPWCREFAVTPGPDNMIIKYKWFGEVGNIVNDIPQLHNNFEHLNELLEERLS